MTYVIQKKTKCDKCDGSGRDIEYYQIVAGLSSINCLVCKGLGITYEEVDFAVVWQEFMFKAKEPVVISREITVLRDKSISDDEKISRELVKRLDYETRQTKPYY